MPAPQPVKKKRLTREEQKKQRHRAMLDAAWILFCKYGYEAVTVDQVAEEVGVSKMPIYYAFGDKQGLFLALWQREVENLLQAIGDNIKPNAPLSENIDVLARMTADAHKASTQNPGENLFFVIQTIALSRPDIAEKLEAISKGTLKFFTEIIAASGLQKTEKLRASPATIAAYFVALINGLATVRFQTGQVDVTAAHLADVLIAAALKPSS